MLDEWNSYYRQNRRRSQQTWEDFLLESGTTEVLDNKISFFDNEYNITGTRVLLSGFTPSRGATGAIVDVSGEGLWAVESVVFSQNNADTLISCPSISGSADGSQLKIGIPAEASQIRGKVNLQFIGGAGGVLEDFEIIDDTSALEFNVVDPALATVPVAAANQVVEYTIEETVGGVVWFVTYKQYPDGTKVRMSSFPKGGSPSG